MGRKKLLLLITLGAFGACSKVNVALDLAPRFVTEILDDYFDMDSKSKSEMRAQIQSDLRSMYSCCFKQAFADLDEKMAGLKGGNAPKEMTDQLIALYDANKPKVLSHAQPDVEKFINGLSEKQWRYFIKEMKENISKDEEELKYRDGNLKKALDRFKRNFEFFCVELEKKHLKTAEEFFVDHDFPYGERIKVKKELVARLEKAGIEEKRMLLIDYSLGQGLDRATYTKASKNFQRQAIDFVFYIYNRLTPEQKRQCYETFHGRVVEFKDYFEPPPKK